MNKEVLLERFKVWALNVILLCRELPKTLHTIHRTTKPRNQKQSPN